MENSVDIVQPACLQGRINVSFGSMRKELIEPTHEILLLVAMLTYTAVLEAGLQIRMRIGKLFSLFLIQNICCGYTKEPSQ